MFVRIIRQHTHQYDTFKMSKDWVRPVEAWTGLWLDQTNHSDQLDLQIYFFKGFTLTDSYCVFEFEKQC